MKRIIFILLMLMGVVLSAYSEHQTVVEFNFDIEDFTVVDDGGGYAQAYSTKFGDTTI